MSNQWSLPGWGSRNGKPEDGTTAMADATAAAEPVVESAEPAEVDAPTADLLIGSADADASAAASDADASPIIGTAEPVATEADPSAVADAPEAEAVATTDAPVAEATAVAEAPAATGTPEAVAAEAPAAEIPTPIEDGPAFLAKLARAMHTTVARERARIDEDIERRRAAHLQAVRDRAAEDVAGIRGLAAEDMKAIETWAEGEMRRIKLEREQRERALNDDLELSLKDRDAKTDREIAAAEAAIAAYRAQAEAFFSDLDREMDPVQIAQQAARHPSFPSLDATPDPVASDRSGGVGVMGVPTGGRTLMGAMSFGSRSLPSDATAGAAQGQGREAGVLAHAGGTSGNHDESLLDSILGRRSGS